MGDKPPTWAILCQGLGQLILKIIEPGDRLDSWKAIAVYLNRSERTVRRWEENENLPVHRLIHDKRGSVYAYKQELNEWWERRGAFVDTEEPVHARAESPAEAVRSVSWRALLWMLAGAFMAAAVLGGLWLI